MSDLIAEIAEDLYQARLQRTATAFVRERIDPEDTESAYAISEAVTQKRERLEGRTRVGRKVGLTNPMVQKRAGVSEPDYGIILDDMVFQTPVTRPQSAYLHPKIEAELAFVLKADITDSSLKSVEAAIDYVVAAIELVDNRYETYAMRIADTIADNAACEGIVLGSVRQPYGELDLRGVEMVLTAGGEELTRGIASNVMGNPILAIQWLAETSIRIGKPLQTGEILLSGSIGLIVDWRPDTPITASYSHGFGEVTAILESGSRALSKEVGIGNTP